MKTDWDYTALAKAYLQRADYARGAMQHLVEVTGLGPGKAACDIGAGTANLTVHLAASGARVDAVEPNDAMRALGGERTAPLSNVHWFEGVGERTGRPPGTFHLATFGSSFNVVDRDAALTEVKRICVDGGWFACLWNHRDTSDLLQMRIEAAIRSLVPGYDTGLRRQDQTGYLVATGRFVSVDRTEHRQEFPQTADELIEAWRSHATLQRQAGDAFPRVVDAIADIARDAGPIVVPYVTRMWLAQLR